MTQFLSVWGFWRGHYTIQIGLCHAFFLEKLQLSIISQSAIIARFFVENYSSSRAKFEYLNKALSIGAGVSDSLFSRQTWVNGIVL